MGGKGSILRFYGDGREIKNMKGQKSNVLRNTRLVKKKYFILKS